MMIMMISVISVICITNLTASHSLISGNFSLPKDKINIFRSACFFWKAFLKNWRGSGWNHTFAKIVTRGDYQKTSLWLIKDVTFSLGRVGLKGNSVNVTEFDGFFYGVPKLNTRELKTTKYFIIDDIKHLLKGSNSDFQNIFHINFIHMHVINLNIYPSIHHYMYVYHCFK